MNLASRIDELSLEFSKAISDLKKFIHDTKRGLQHVVRFNTDLARKIKTQAAGEPIERQPEETYTEISLTEQELDFVMKAIEWNGSSLSGHDVTLLNMGLMYLVGLFDAFTSDIFSAVLSSNPTMLKSKKQLTYETILDLGTEQKIAQYMAQRELNEVGYKSPAEQWSYYKDRFGVDIEKSQVSLQQIIEINAQRNLLAHNRGRVNRTYLSTSAHPKLAWGDHVVVTEADWQDYLESMQTLANFITEALKSNFAKPSIAIATVQSTTQIEAKTQPDDATLIQ